MKQQLTWLIIAILASTVPLHVAAQTDNWTGVRALPKGAELVIERKSSGRVVGYLELATDDTVVIVSDANSFIIGRDNVKKIYYAVAHDKKKSMNRGALIGMIGGAVTASLIAGEPEGQEMPGLGGLLIGGLAGTWFGKQRAKGKKRGALIYSASF
jgi:hypothetical protein